MPMSAAPHRPPENRLAGLDGIVGAATVDLDRGTVRAFSDRGPVEDLELGALLDGHVLQEARAAASAASGAGELRTIVMTLGDQHHVIVPSRRVSRRFLYLVVDRHRLPIGLLLHHLAEVELL
jgi:hypothetical protein